MATKALEGITVVACSLAESGPVTSQILAFLGATVIHIERPNANMDGRYKGSIIRNSNKKAITLDTKKEEGKEIMWKLIEKADVFFENFAPGAWDRMGFSYEEVIKRNPNILYCSLKGFAKKSQWGNCITYDPVACCSGGAASTCGYENLYPMLCGINVADSGAAIHAAMAICIALLKRKITGKGQYMECPMQNAVTVECRPFFAEYYANGGKVRRAGNAYRGLKPYAPHNIYPTQGSDVTGNYIVIDCGPDNCDEYFAKLCECIGRKDLLEDPRYATAELRYENRLALDVEIARWTQKYTKDTCMNILMKDYGIPAGMVNSMQDICNDEFLNTTIMQHMPDPNCGDLHMPIIPVNMEKHKIVAETCGKHGTANDEVYRGFLGLSDAEMEKLKEDKIICV